MLISIITLLYRSKWFLLLSIGYLLTSIGSGLSQVAVYGFMADNNSPAHEFSTAFALSVLPTLFAIRIGERLLRIISPYSILISAELIGICAMLIPWFAIKFHSSTVIMFSAVLPAITTGLGVSSYSLLLKRGFRDEDYPTISALESITLSANVMFGTGLGAILQPFVPSEIYLIIDGLTFFLAAILLLCAKRVSPSGLDALDASQIAQFELNKCKAGSDGKIIATIMVPGVSLIVSPMISLLPAAGVLFRSSNYEIPVNAALMLLFARGLSQIVGPLLWRVEQLAILYKNKRNVIVLLVAFFILYMCAISSDSLSLAMLLVLIAHIIGYALNATAQTAMLKEYSEEEIVRASSKIYQAQLILMFFASLVAGCIAGILGIKASMVIMFIFSSMLVVLAYSALSANNRSRKS